MGKLKVTIEHGHDNTMVYFMVIIALIIMMAAAAAPAIAFATAAATVVVQTLKIILMGSLALICLGGLIWCGFGIRSHIRDERIANEWRAREQEKAAEQRLKAHSPTAPTHNQINAERAKTGIPPIGKSGDTYVLKVPEMVRLDR